MNSASTNSTAGTTSKVRLSSPRAARRCERQRPSRVAHARRRRSRPRRSSPRDRRARGPGRRRDARPRPASTRRVGAEGQVGAVRRAARSRRTRGRGIPLAATVATRPPLPAGTGMQVVGPDGDDGRVARLATGSRMRPATRAPSDIDDGAAVRVSDTTRPASRLRKPMNSATSRWSGRANRSSGVPTWRTSPSRITTMRSASDSASSWSCVT